MLKDKLKGAFRSLTIWFNGIILLALPVVEFASLTLPQLQEFLGVETYKLVGLIVVVSNILLRFKTKEPLAEK
jgi:hypothetical protein